MTTSSLPLLQNAELRARVSDATLRVLEQRANPAPRSARYFSDEQFAQLQQIVDAILPQGQVGTTIDLADSIDRRLQNGITQGWRFAVLPPDGEAYRQGLAAFAAMLQQTPMKTFAAMPVPAREGYLRCVANGDVDGPSHFPLSKWLQLVRTDVVQTWTAHPSTMQAMGYFGFADGATGNEGWQAIGPNSAAPFEVESIQAFAAAQVAAPGSADPIGERLGDGSVATPPAGVAV